MVNDFRRTRMARYCLRRGRLSATCFLPRVGGASVGRSSGSMSVCSKRRVKSEHELHELTRI